MSLRGYRKGKPRIPRGSQYKVKYSTDTSSSLTSLFFHTPLKRGLPVSHSKLYLRLELKEVSGDNPVTKNHYKTLNSLLLIERKV